MDKYKFPAIFDPSEEDDGYTVTFPDLPGCITEGDTWEEAQTMAQEALEGFLYLMEEEGESIPAPSEPRTISVPPGAVVSVVEAWMDIVRDEMANKVVRTNVTLPKWLKDAAEERNFNFSQLLQHAIKQRLNIHSQK
nr:type II toxin-antitoxin system HicB family antitoxin [Bacilli bacterium]